MSNKDVVFSQNWIEQLRYDYPRFRFEEYARCRLSSALRRACESEPINIFAWTSCGAVNNPRIWVNRNHDLRIATRPRLTT